jgi:hypothetical protein
VSDRSVGRRASGSVARPLQAEIDARFPNLLKNVRVWLAEQPEILKLLMQIEKYVANSEVSAHDVSRLAKRWQDNLPARRGEVVNLSDFMQTEFELGLPRRRARDTRPRRIRQSRIAGRKRS